MLRHLHLLRQIPDPPANVIVTDFGAKNLCAAAIRDHQSQEDLYQGRFARPVASEESKDGSRFDSYRNAFQCARLAAAPVVIALDQIVGFHRGMGHSESVKVSRVL